MILKNHFRVEEVLKPTGARLFKNLKEGDRIRITTEVDHLGHLKPELEIKCLSSDTQVTKSFNEFSNIAKNFRFAEERI